MQSGEYDDLRLSVQPIDDCEPIYDRLMNKDVVFRRPKSPIRSRSPTLGSRKHEDNVGYTRIKRAVKPTRASVVPATTESLGRSQSEEPESMEYRVEEYSPGVRARITSSTRIGDHKPQMAAPLSEKYSQRRMTTGNTRRPAIEVSCPSPGQVNELTKRFSFQSTSPGATGNKHSSKIPVSNIPLKATTKTSEMTKTTVPVRAVSSGSKPSQIPTMNGDEEKIKLRNKWSNKARPASWDVSTLLDSQESDVFVTKDDTSKTDIEIESFHRNSNVRTAFRRKSSSREFSPEPLESSPETSPPLQRKTAPHPSQPIDSKQQIPASPGQGDQSPEVQKLSQGSQSSHSSQGSGPPTSVRERTKKWEARGGGVPSYFTLPKSFRHKATDKRKDSLSSIPSPSSTKPPMTRRTTINTINSPTSTGSKILYPGSSIPQPSSRLHSPRSSVSSLAGTSTKSLGTGRKVSLSREEADGSSNPDETFGGSLESKSKTSRQPVIKTRTLTVSVSKSRGDSLLPTKTVVSTPTSVSVCCVCYYIHNAKGYTSMLTLQCCHDGDRLIFNPVATRPNVSQHSPATAGLV